MPRKAPLNGLEYLQPVWADIATPNSRQYDHGYQSRRRRPDHDGENMQRRAITTSSILGLAWA
jgi:hypothetical protein